MAGGRLMAAKSFESNGDTDGCRVCVHLSLRGVCCWETDLVVIEDPVRRLSYVLSCNLNA